MAENSKNQLGGINNQRLTIKNVQVTKDGVIIVTYAIKNGVTKEERFSSYKSVFDALSGRSYSILKQHMELLQRGLEMENGTLKKEKNNKDQSIKKNNTTTNPDSSRTVPELKVHLSGDALFVNDLSGSEKIYWSFSDKPRSLHLYDKKSGIHARKVKNKTIMIKAFKNSKLICSCKYMFPDSIINKYMIQGFKVSDDGKKILEISIQGHYFKDFDSAEKFIYENIPEQKRKDYIDRLSSERNASSEKRKRIKEALAMKKKPLKTTSPVITNKPANKTQNKESALRAITTVPKPKTLKNVKEKIKTTAQNVERNTQENNLDRIMQEAKNAIKFSDYSKIRELYLLAYRTRIEKKESGKASKLLNHILNEASTSLINDLTMASHLFDLYYEIKELDSTATFIKDDSIHIWGDCLVDWKRLIVMDSANDREETLELPEGVIGISKDFERVMAKSKSIHLPSSFRFIILEDNHLGHKPPKEFLTKHCGKTPNISVSNLNRYINEKDGIIYLRNGNIPIILADNTLTNVILPEDMTSASSDLFMNPERITSITIPRSVRFLSGKKGDIISFFKDLPNLRTVRITPGNAFFTATNNTVNYRNETVMVLPVGEELDFPFRTERCLVPIPDYWKECASIQFPGFFLVSNYKKIVEEVRPKKQRINLTLFRKLEQSSTLYRSKFTETVVYDAFGEIPLDQLSFGFRKRARLQDGTVAPAVPLGINDIVSVLNTFQCVSNGHEIIEIIGLVGYSRGDEPPKEKGVRCFFCRTCNKYFMYSTDFNTNIYPLIASKNCMFTKFSYNGKLYDSSLGLHTDGFAQESLLRKAGYQVNQSTNLTAVQRLSILMFLYDRGVSPHFILSYLNQFITLNGSSFSKDMSVAVSRWREDMEEFKAQVFGTGRGKH